MSVFFIYSDKYRNPFPWASRLQSLDFLHFDVNNQLDAETPSKQRRDRVTVYITWCRVALIQAGGVFPSSASYLRRYIAFYQKLAKLLDQKMTTHLSTLFAWDAPCKNNKWPKLILRPFVTKYKFIWFGKWVYSCTICQLCLTLVHTVEWWSISFSPLALVLPVP